MLSGQHGQRTKIETRSRPWLVSPQVASSPLFPIFMEGQCQTDRKIMSSCGLIEKLEAGDSVMGDKGFIVKDFLSYCLHPTSD